jgi:hypothetical protein
MWLMRWRANEASYLNKFKVLIFIFSHKDWPIINAKYPTIEFKGPLLEMKDKLENLEFHPTAVQRFLQDTGQSLDHLITNLETLYLWWSFLKEFSFACIILFLKGSF